MCKKAHSLVVLAPGPHDNVRRARLGLLRLFFRFIGSPRAFRGSKQARHDPSGISSKNIHTGTKKALRSFC